MQNYKIKMKLLTPVHIGTGEDYEPTNFIIDEDFLYEFDEMQFYTYLGSSDKERFISLAKCSTPDALFEMHTFIKSHKEMAKKAAILKVKVAEGISRDYKNKIGRAVQQEGKQKVFNRFQIARTLRQPNGKIPYIPGSSLKGSIATAVQEVFFKENKEKYKEAFVKANPSERFMKNFLVSDSIAVKSGAMVGYALNKERFEDDQDGPSNKLEVILPGSEYETHLSSRDYTVKFPVDVKTFMEACNTHYLPLFESMMSSYNEFKGKKVDDYINEYFSDTFYDTYKSFTPAPNQFLVRVGKHSGARAVTVDGMRKIKVKVSGGGPKRKPNKWETLDQETTTWLFGKKENQNENLLPFGWVLCELI